jgi:hypothetical protein
LAVQAYFHSWRCLLPHITSSKTIIFAQNMNIGFETALHSPDFLSCVLRVSKIKSKYLTGLTLKHVKTFR